MSKGRPSSPHKLNEQPGARVEDGAKDAEKNAQSRRFLPPFRRYLQRSDLLVQPEQHAAFSAQCTHGLESVAREKYSVFPVHDSCLPLVTSARGHNMYERNAGSRWNAMPTWAIGCQ